jgi:hypothetical protein
MAHFSRELPQKGSVPDIVPATLPQDLHVNNSSDESTSTPIISAEQTTRHNMSLSSGEIDSLLLRPQLPSLMRGVLNDPELAPGHRVPPNSLLIEWSAEANTSMHTDSPLLQARHRRTGDEAINERRKRCRISSQAN